MTFDPQAVFGKRRAPVRVTLNGFTYRSTIVAMGGVCCVPLRRSNREAAGLRGGETLDVTFELDTDKRVVVIPAELAGQLKGKAGLDAAWSSLSHTSQREYAEAILGAKKPGTRARRVEKVLDSLILIANSAA